MWPPFLGLFDYGFVEHGVSLVDAEDPVSRLEDGGYAGEE